MLKSAAFRHKACILEEMVAYILPITCKRLLDELSRAQKAIGNLAVTPPWGGFNHQGRRMPLPAWLKPPVEANASKTCNLSILFEVAPIFLGQPSPSMDRRYATLEPFGVVKFYAEHISPKFRRSRLYPGELFNSKMVAFMACYQRPRRPCCEKKRITI
jgi:hypothetical protein